MNPTIKQWIRAIVIVLVVALAAGTILPEFFGRSEETAETIYLVGLAAGIGIAAWDRWYR